MKYTPLGKIDRLEYALITEATPEETSLASLVTLPQFFVVCSKLIKKPEEKFWKVRELMSGLFYTSTVLAGENTGVRIRPDRNVQAAGWSDLVPYPWNDLWSGMRKRDKPDLEKHTLFKALFGENPKGLYRFGISYAPDKFYMRFEGRVNNNPFKYCTPTIDMAYDDGTDPGVIEIGFVDFPLKENLPVEFKGKGIICLK